MDKSRVGEMPAMEDREAFGAALAERIRASLRENRVGEAGAEKGGVVLF